MDEPPEHRRPAEAVAAVEGVRRDTIITAAITLHTQEHTMIETFTTKSRTCPICGGEQFVQVNSDDYQRWINGEGMIQDVMPYIPAEVREILISGICPTCWDKISDEE